jgi:hypothetical protein
MKPCGSLSNQQGPRTSKFRGCQSPRQRLQSRRSLAEGASNMAFVIADSAFKRKQVDARACRLDTGEHHPGLALRTSGARNCSEWNGGRKALRLGHDAFPRIGGSATLSARWFELTTKGRPRTRRPNLAGFSLLFAGGGLLLLTRRIAMLLGNSRKSGGPPLFAPSFKVQRDNAHNPSSGFRGRPRSRRP